MIKRLNIWKKIIMYGLIIFFIFSFSTILIIMYNLYIHSINNVNSETNNSVQEVPCNDDNKIKMVQRIDQLKVGYKVDNEKNPHIFLIDVIKIDGCKYIMVHNHIEGDTDLALIHANNCTNCKK